MLPQPPNQSPRHQLGKPQKGKKAQVGEVICCVQMWDPAAHHTPALPKLRVLRVTVIACTNLATRDAQRANNPFVW
eukprot:SAG22_NODE_7144_length_771_cov_1.916667_1_plen_75_part_10